MEDDRMYRDLITVMELQVRGMEDFQVTQLVAAEALKTKDWPALDKALRSLDFQSEGLRCLEERRHSLWAMLQVNCLGREGRFYEVLPWVPETYRETLNRLHKELKTQTLQLKGLSQGLASYVETAGALVRAVVHEIQPALKGRLYSRSGSTRPAQARPLVLNTHF